MLMSHYLAYPFRRLINIMSLTDIRNVGPCATVMCSFSPNVLVREVLFAVNVCCRFEAVVPCDS
jgi:hypothetical protein